MKRMIFGGHFEERLADFDAHSLVENCEHLVVPYSSEEWSDAFHHDFAFELDQIVLALSEGLMSAFTNWVSQIVVPSRASLSVPRARIDSTARFISFNYTDTLQRLYGVSSDRVWHIHGAAAGSDPLVLGHGWRPRLDETWGARLDVEHEDVRFAEGARIIDRYFARSFKPTDKIIADNSERFAALVNVDDIRVLGHSFSDVDLPYMKEIFASVRPRARWRISYRGSSSMIEAQFAKIASPARTTFMPLPEI